MYTRSQPTQQEAALLEEEQAKREAAERAEALRTRRNSKTDEVCMHKPRAGGRVCVHAGGAGALV